MLYHISRLEVCPLLLIFNFYYFAFDQNGHQEINTCKYYKNNWKYNLADFVIPLATSGCNYLSFPKSRSISCCLVVLLGCRFIHKRYSIPKTFMVFLVHRRIKKPFSGGDILVKIIFTKLSPSLKGF